MDDNETQKLISSLAIQNKEVSNNTNWKNM